MVTPDTLLRWYQTLIAHHNPTWGYTRIRSALYTSSRHNRPLEDQLGTVHHLEASADPVAQALGAFTKKQLDAAD